MSDSSLWSRLRHTPFFRILLIYLGLSWIVLQVVITLRDALGLPFWVGPACVIMLGVGLLALLATALVQSHPLTRQREAADEVPGAWDLDLAGARDALLQGELPHLTWGRTLSGVFLALCILFGVAGAYVVIKDRGRSFTPSPAIAEEAVPGIAVLPFSVRGDGMEMWREGMVDLLSTGLDGVSGLRTIDSRTVLAQWRGRVGDHTADRETALEVARSTGAEYALLGSAVAVGSSVRLVADIYDPENGTELGQVQVQGSPDSVLSLVDRLAVESLLLVLEVGEDRLPEVDVAGITTSSIPALEAWLGGEAMHRRGDFAGAVAAYEKAVEVDPAFALAWYQLWTAYGWY